MRTLFQQITDEVATAIETGAGEYQMPWHAAELGLPSNAISGRTYRGINTLLLWAQARNRGYRSSKWATYRQWREAGAQVRAGETATTVLFWKSLGNAEGEDGGADEDNIPVRFTGRTFRVFNSAQVDSFEESLARSLTEADRIERAERFFKQLPASVWYGGGHAFYDYKSDLISMPDFASFKQAERFYSVLGHEMIHWSGANHRLGRDLKNRFGSEADAMEELVAELGAAFLGAHLELAIEPRRDHAPYIASWLRVLRNDPRAIITAASKAQIATSYLLELAGEAQTAAENAA